MQSVVAKGRLSCLTQIFFLPTLSECKGFESKQYIIVWRHYRRWTSLGSKSKWIHNIAVQMHKRNNMYSSYVQGAYTEIVSVNINRNSIIVR